MVSHVYNLRSRRAFSVLLRAMGRVAERFGVRIVHFAVEGNHVHLVVEAAAIALPAPRTFLLKLARAP